MATWKKPQTISRIEDFDEHAERTILDTAKKAGAFGKSEHKVLVALLDTRNDYAHPSGRTISPAVAESFIEQTIDHVLLKYT